MMTCERKCFRQTNGSGRLTREREGGNITELAFLDFFTFLAAKTILFLLSIFYNKSIIYKITYVTFLKNRTMII